MYLPKRFQETRLSELHRLITDFPLATLVVQDQEGPLAYTLPLILDPTRGPHGTLLGHMARANPLSKMLNGPVLCIFNGPNGYISPAWYPDPLNVPTWNYATVQARGKIQWIQSIKEIENILTLSTEAFEKQNGTQWKYELPSEFTSELIQGIVGIEILIDKIEGKFKLGQSGAPQDREGAVNGLISKGTERSKELAAFMQNAKPPAQDSRS